ncbi:Hsp70 family protein [Dactylosporangium sp. NPDC049742]|uniref:Hsp70 family protein n=1 Tax=Dactylosporangium sp. NPDC049742 TaxID=3154737 RepID=UPI003437ECEB
MTGFRLGVDFGTSTTIAMLRRPDGRVQPLLFDGSPLLSSAVLLGPDGRLHTGRDAAHLARSAPERLEPNPKRRVDDTSVLLGDAEVGVRELVAAVLQRVATEAARVAGPVTAVTLTHPANWGAGRRAVLVDAARQVGFADVDLVGEPVAAATYLAATRGGEVPVGACVVVYDLGAGTCDVTVLRRSPHGFEPVASDGLNDVGGLDVDATVVAFLEATYGTLWSDAAGRRQLWDDVRSAKEMLSRASGTVVMVPALRKEVPLGREQLEGLARPVLRQTVSMTRSLLTEAAVPASAIAGLFLVGGSSRIPLVATMLHESIGIAPIVAEQPELVVAEGALHATGSPAGAVPGSPVSGLPATPNRPGPGQQPFQPAGTQPTGAHGFPGAAPASPAPVAFQPGHQTTGAPVSGTPFSAAPFPAGPAAGPPTTAPFPGGPTSGAPTTGPFPGGSTSGPPATGPFPGRPTSAPPTTGIYDTGAYTGGMPAAAFPDSTVAGGMRPAPMPVSASPYASAPTSATPGGPPSATPTPLPPAAPGWQPPGQRPASGGGGRAGGIAVGLGLILVVVLLLGGGVVAYVLLKNGDKGGGGGPGGTSTTGGQASGPGRFQMTKLPQNICPTIDLTAITSQYEAAVGDPTPSRNLNTYAGTASCTVSRMHKSGNTVTTASVMAMPTVYKDLASGSAVAKQLRDSAALNGTVTDVPGVGEQAFTYADLQQPAAPTFTLVGVDSNLVCTITLIVGAGGKALTDAQVRDLQSRLIQVGKGTFPKLVAAIS